LPRGRRFFSKADKQRILQAADRCTAPGEIGALMRREGVYSSSLSTWRQQRKAAELAALAPRLRGPKPAADRDQVLQIAQREAADLAALAPQERGPKADPNRAEALHIAQLTRDNDRLKSRLDKALFVIEVQKKVAALLGHPLDDNGEST
jgi:transposase-like protein